jgi:hypothetical protein
MKLGAVVRIVETDRIGVVYRIRNKVIYDRPYIVKFLDDTIEECSIDEIEEVEKNS